MLTELMRLVEQNHGELDLREISRQLGAQPGAVAGMIDTLVRKGRLTEVMATCGPCDSCAIQKQCSLTATTPARRFEAASRGRVDPE